MTFTAKCVFNMPPLNKLASARHIRAPHRRRIFITKTAYFAVFFLASIFMQIPKKVQGSTDKQRKCWLQIPNSHLVSLLVSLCYQQSPHQIIIWQDAYYKCHKHYPVFTLFRITQRVLRIVTLFTRHNPNKSIGRVCTNRPTNYAWWLFQVITIPVKNCRRCEHIECDNKNIRTKPKPNKCHSPAFRFNHRTKSRIQSTKKWAYNSF